MVDEMELATEEAEMVTRSIVHVSELICSCRGSN